MSLRFAALADDVTGATDLAGSWRRRGLRTAVIFGEPTVDDLEYARSMDAVVFALKIRSIDADDASDVAKRVGEALAPLTEVQVYDKYCSTFDSTPEGNIGPIADALATALEAERAVVVPSMPANGRTVYQGHLFVHDQLLSESPMRNHPLNPMRDSSIVRLLQAQTSRQVGMVPLSVVREGTEALRQALDSRQAGGDFYIVVDAVDDSDLEVISAATAQDRLVTGGSGLALGTPAASVEPEPLRAINGRKIILAGSASTATKRQVAKGEASYASRTIDPVRATEDPSALAEELISWADQEWAHSPDKPVLIHSDAESLGGRAPTRTQAEGIERAMAELARRAFASGVRQFLVAGGETSGSVIAALEIDRLELGEEVDPGVSWALGHVRPRGTEAALHCNLLLKSGNFGSNDLFTTAWEAL